MALEIERYRAFIENSTEGIWRIEVGVPVSVRLPEDEQINAFYEAAYLAEANDAFARMYGFDTADAMLGARLGDLLVREDPTNQEYLRAFIRSGYRLGGVDSVERDRHGNVRHFSNTLTGVIEEGHLVRAWGTQRDVTIQKGLEESLRESEDRFRAVFEQAAFPIVVFTLDGKHLMANQAAADFMGYTREELLALPAVTVIHPDQRGLLPELLPRLLSGRADTSESGGPGTSHVTVRRHYRRKDGAERWGITTINVLRDANDQPNRLLATTTDITAQTEAEQRREEAIVALRESEERLRLALASGGLGTWDADLVAGTLTLSEEMGPLYGRPRAAETLSVTQWADRLHPEDRQRVSEVFAAAVRAESDFDVQFRTLWADGVTVRWVATRALVTHDAGGKPIRAVGYTRDITGEKEAEAVREALLQRQRQFMRDMVFSLTEGQFRLCLSEADLPSPLEPASETVELDLATLRVLRQRVRAVTERMHFPKERAQDLETAVGEGAMNAYVHAGGGKGWVCAAPGGEQVQVWVQDWGGGISEDALPRVLEKGVSSAGTLGHGFWLMLRTCDRIHLLTGPGGTTVVLEQDRVPREPAWLESSGLT